MQSHYYYVFFVWNFLMEPTETNKPLKLIQPTGISNTQIVEKRVTHKIWDENDAYRSLVQHISCVSFQFRKAAILR
jgi:hypothetical protein